MNKAIAWMIVMLMMANLALALGVSPGRTTLNFEPGREKTITVEVLNNDRKDFDAVIFAEGVMAEFIELSANELQFTKDIPKQSFTYTVILPEEFDKPGIQTADIMITEKVKSQAQVTANIGVITSLFVNVPYPGLWAEAQIRTNNVKQGDELVFFIKVFNMGQNEISSAHAKIDIYSQGELYKSLTTEPRPIGHEKYGELILKMDSTEFRPGDYTVDAKVLYDGNEILLNSKFSVDAFLVNLISISVDDYTFGGIAGFAILVQNIGNRLVEGFSSRVTLERGNIANIKSYSIDIGPDETKKTVAYWDTKDIQMGEYEGILAMTYENELFEQEIKTTVNAQSIDVEVVSPITGQVIIESPKKTGNMLKYLNIIVLASIALFLILISLKNIKKRK